MVNSFKGDTLAEITNPTSELLVDLGEPKAAPIIGDCREKLRRSGMVGQIVGSNHFPV